MGEVGFVAALAAGVLALLSPCSALLLPSFFAYAFAGPTALLMRTLAFYVGLCLTLVPLGAGVGAASTFFYGHRAVLITIAGWLIIGFGALLLAGKGFSLPLMDRISTAVSRAGGTGWLGTALLGAVYGLAGFCSGPVLGAILTVAATQGSPWRGAGLLAVYALGMALPLFVLAAVWDRFDLGHRRWLRGRTVALGRLRVHTTSLVAGVLFVVIGILFLRYDGTAGLTGALGLGDTTDLEFSLQQTVQQWAGSVPAWLPLLVVAGVAGVVALRRAGRAEPADSPSPTREEDCRASAVASPAEARDHHAP